MSSIPSTSPKKWRGRARSDSDASVTQPDVLPSARRGLNAQHNMETGKEDKLADVGISAPGRSVGSRQPSGLAGQADKTTLPGVSKLTCPDASASSGPRPAQRNISPQEVGFAYFCDLLDGIASIGARKVKQRRDSGREATSHDISCRSRCARMGVGAPPCTCSPSGSSSAADEPKALRLFRSWVAGLPAGTGPGPEACAPGTGALVFRLLFPEEDSRRRYGLQEILFGRSLGVALGVSTRPGHAGQKLVDWNCSGVWDEGKSGDGERWAQKEERNEGSGCLGLEVMNVLNKRAQPTEKRGNVRCGDEEDDEEHTALTLAQVDALLDELASHCKFSALEGTRLPSSRAAAQTRSRSAILQELYGDMGPWEAACLTQIILRDLRPILYQLPGEARIGTLALTQYNSNAYYELEKKAVMDIWHPWMPWIYARRAQLDDAACAVEGVPRDQRLDGRHPLMQLEPGRIIEVSQWCAHTVKGNSYPVADSMRCRPFSCQLERYQIPKCIKGLSCHHVAKTFGFHGKVWAETKYDGERMQIHVDLDALEPHGRAVSGAWDGAIQIWSKSKRNSTHDRRETHA